MAHGFFNVFFVCHIYMECKTCVTHVFFNGLFGVIYIYICVYMCMCVYVYMCVQNRKWASWSAYY